MSAKVSIIIPVYNASKYLKKMIDSLYMQTLKEIEFIFVDDASTDNSLDILYEAEKRDKERVIIVKLEENSGPGMARNIGLKYASGEYIGFADSDDKLEKNMYECLYNKAYESDYDIVECGYYSERKKRDMMLLNESYEGNISFDNRVKMIMACGFLWTKIYKRKLIIDSQIEFIPDIPFEDVDFLSRIYLRADSIGVVNKSLYYYRDNKNSFSHTRNNKGFIEVNKRFSEIYIKHMKNDGVYDILKPVIDYVIMEVWFDLFKSMIIANDNITYKELNIIDVNLKKYVNDYKDNIFFKEKCKNDCIRNAFLINAEDSNRALYSLTK
ncbi:MAG: glycosyltransferase [Clostridiales bacterium]|nr:glycosyltransferase [Clostridiales bacterium]